jgi:hypothetical protein
MTAPVESRPGNIRVAVVIVLALAAVVLYYLDTHPAAFMTKERPQLSASLNDGIQAVVDTMFGRYGIARSSVRMWNVLSAEKKPMRVVQQIQVPREFPSLIFNDQLQRLLEPMEARVFATERSRDNIVTMHIVHHGETIRSLAFSMVGVEE